MNEELKIKVQAFLDGELPESEAREISARLAREADLAALCQELKLTRAALAGFDRPLAVPESREFYWSKIRRELERAGTAPERPSRVPVSLLARLRRALVPATGLALLMAAAWWLIPRSGPSPDLMGMEVASMDGSAMTYRDYASGTTLVWLSFPAENGLSGGRVADKIN